MTKFKVIHFKNDCISCGACAAINPDFWSLDEDGVAHLKGSKEVEGQWELIIESIADMASNKETEDACPAQVIKVEEVEE
ncbi:ferredoxin [archaeon]|jgi:ferredoxin|nr:ferredoxin [archaeon]MBT3450400.1 ferredoxin [archaeon]MBT6868622.1 ferredoxin [archaeon]MBT7193411.1 ferredoxin [archaeon]MBT7381419.1 ferredoxin [archaeon]